MKVCLESPGSTWVRLTVSSWRPIREPLGASEHLRVGTPAGFWWVGGSNMHTLPLQLSCRGMPSAFSLLHLPGAGPHWDLLPPLTVPGFWVSRQPPTSLPGGWPKPTGRRAPLHRLGCNPHSGSAEGPMGAFSPDHPQNLQCVSLSYRCPSSRMLDQDLLSPEACEGGACLSALCPFP